MRDIFAKNMQKQYLRMLAVLIGIAMISGAFWFMRPQQSEQKSPGIQVAATFFPLADFAREVGGEYVQVTQITPDGVDVHDYEPSPQDVATFLSADVALVNGGGLDAWAEKLIADAEAQGVAVLRMSDVVPFLEVTDDHSDEHEGEGEDEHAHEGSLDPHAWLDLERTQIMAQAIGEALAEKDPQNAEFYTQRTQAFQKDLEQLNERFISTLATCESKTIFAAHDAFSYWKLRYTIEVYAVSGISGEGEPSVRALAELIQEAQEQRITTVFFESPASTALATTIANEIGATVDVLYPLESRTSEQVAQGETYLTLMNANLHALAKALTCQQ